MEYDYAIETKKPVIAFLHGEPDLIPQSKLDRDPKLAKKLKVFRNKASDKRTCEFWTSPADLAWKVSSGIAELKKTRPEGGWIKAHLAGSPDKLQQLQQRIQELETQLAVLRANPERSVRELPSEALDLLSEAAKSGGQIRVISTLTSYHVQVGNRVVNEPKDRQSEGLYRAFLSKLSAEGLIERTSDHIYRLTLEGYELAKNLPKS
jgi:hypothetical protein